jgi:hypothetical protein
MGKISLLEGGILMFCVFCLGNRGYNELDEFYYRRI